MRQASGWQPSRGSAELHVRRIDVLDGVSEVDVAILSEVGQSDLHSVPDDRDAHTRAEVSKRCRRPAGRAMNR